MSFRRRVAGIAVALVALGGPALVAHSAEAAPAAPTAKIKRTITVSGIEPRPNRFFLKGQVSPTDGVPAKAIVQRKNCQKCGWFKYRGFTTGKSGRYKESVVGPKRGQKRAYYRIKVPATDTYTSVTSDVLYIYRG